MHLAADAAILFVVVLAGGFIALRLHSPLLLAYILAGIAFGPCSAGIAVTGIHGIELLAETDVEHLLFALGIEYSLQ